MSLFIRQLILCFLAVRYMSAHPTCWALGPANAPTLPPVDCAHVITQIPAVEFRPDRQQRHGRLTLTLPKNAYTFIPPARFIHGICEVTVDVQNHHTGLCVTPPAGHMQFQLWGEAKLMAQEVFDQCIYHGIGGFSYKIIDVPGYMQVRLWVEMKSRSRHTYHV